MIKILSDAGTKVQGICSQAKSKIQAAFSSSIEKIKACVKIIFAACVNAQARICGLGQAGHKAIVLVARNSVAKLDGTLRKTPQLQVQVKAQAEVAEKVVAESAPVVVEESKPAPALSKMERVKQAVKDGSATVAKAMHDHPRISAVVIAAGMFGIGKILQAKFSSTKPDQGHLPDWTHGMEGHSAEYELDLEENLLNEPFIGASAIAKQVQSEEDMEALTSNSSGEDYIAFDSANVLQHRKDEIIARQPNLRFLGDDVFPRERAEAQRKFEKEISEGALTDQFADAVAYASFEKEISEGALTDQFADAVAIASFDQHMRQANVVQRGVENAHSRYPASVGVNNRWKWQAAEAQAQAKAEAEAVVDAFGTKDVRKTIFGGAKEAIIQAKSDKIDQLVAAFGKRATEKAEAEAQAAVTAFGTKEVRETIFGDAKRDLAPVVARKEQIERMKRGELAAAFHEKTVAEAEAAVTAFGSEGVRKTLFGKEMKEAIAGRVLKTAEAAADANLKAATGSTPAPTVVIV